MPSAVRAGSGNLIWPTPSFHGSSELEKFPAPLIVLPFDAAAVWFYGDPRGDPRADPERRGTPIGSLDTMITAHALSQQALLGTNNTREFAKVSGLQLDNRAAAA